jgi:hypothetical protein
MEEIEKEKVEEERESTRKGGLNVLGMKSLCLGRALSCCSGRVSHVTASLLSFGLKSQREYRLLTDH